MSKSCSRANVNSDDNNMDIAKERSVFLAMHSASIWCQAILQQFPKHHGEYLKVREMVGQFMGDVFTGVMRPLQRVDKTLEFAINDPVFDSSYLSDSAELAFDRFLDYAGKALQTHSDYIRARENAGFFVRGTLDEIFDDYLAIQNFSRSQQS